MPRGGGRPSDRFIDPSVSHHFIHVGTLADAADRLFAPESKRESSVFANRAVASEVIEDACEQIGSVYRIIAGPPSTDRAFLDVRKTNCGIGLQWKNGRLRALKAQKAKVVFVRPDPASNRVAILTAYPQFNKKDPRAEIDLEAAICASRRFRSAPYEEALPIRLAAHLGQDVHVLMDEGAPRVYLPIDSRRNPGLHLVLTIGAQGISPSGFATKAAGDPNRALFDAVPKGFERLMGVDARKALATYCQVHQGFSKKLMRAPKLVENPKAITDAELARRAMAFQRETKAASEEIRQRREGALRATSRIRGPKGLGR